MRAKKKKLICIRVLSNHASHVTAAIVSIPGPSRAPRSRGARGDRRRSASAVAQRGSAPSGTRRVVANFWQMFGKISLVFGCIGADLCKWIRVLQHVPNYTRCSSWNFWKLTMFCRFCNICKNFAEFSQKLLIFQTNFLLKFWDCSGAKVRKSCKAWKMLSSAYFLAKFRFDTAENEPAKNLQNSEFCQFC